MKTFGIIPETLNTTKFTLPNVPYVYYMCDIHVIHMWCLGVLQM